jgi:hypothetical protein
LFIYIASHYHACSEIILHLFCRALFATFCWFARHAQRKGFVRQNPAFFATSTVIAVALRMIGNCARQTNASAISKLNFVDVADL